jgi:hypothetical protein
MTLNIDSNTVFIFYLKQLYESGSEGYFHEQRTVCRSLVGRFCIIHSAVPIWTQVTVTSCGLSLCCQLVPSANLVDILLPFAVRTLLYGILDE